MEESKKEYQRNICTKVLLMISPALFMSVILLTYFCAYLTLIDIRKGITLDYFIKNIVEMTLPFAIFIFFVLSSIPIILYFKIRSQRLIIYDNKIRQINNRKKEIKIYNKDIKKIIFCKKKNGKIKYILINSENHYIYIEDYNNKENILKRLLEINGENIEFIDNTKDG